MPYCVSDDMQLTTCSTIMEAGMGMGTGSSITMEAGMGMVADKGMGIGNEMQNENGNGNMQEGYEQQQAGFVAALFDVFCYLIW
ncbi:hypothetical protein L1887_38686 [Cichorium endivia]|nr:hypothetical protein L1887_38686 [Cichorium endivia]